MLNPEQQLAKDNGITNALSVVPESITNQAVRFFHAYAQVHYRFSSSEVMSAFITAFVGINPGNGKGWRDSWGGITKLALKEGIMKHCGFVRTPEKHRHEPFGKLYQSCVYTLGDEVDFPDNELQLLSEVVANWRKGATRDPMDLAKKAYELGFYCSTM